jgi:hypothetical protein
MGICVSLKISIDGTEYTSMASAVETIGVSVAIIKRRCTSPKWPTWNIIGSESLEPKKETVTDYQLYARRNKKWVKLRNKT